MEAEDARLSF